MQSAKDHIRPSSYGELAYQGLFLDLGVWDVIWELGRGDGITAAIDWG